MKKDDASLSRFHYIWLARLAFKRQSIKGHNELACLVAEFVYGFDARVWIRTLRVLDEMPFTLESQELISSVAKLSNTQSLYWQGFFYNPNFFIVFHRHNTDVDYSAVIDPCSKAIVFFCDDGSLKKPPLDDLAQFIIHSPLYMKNEAKKSAMLWKQHESARRWRER